MANALTLAQMRDEIRRMIGINPPIDQLSNSPAGQQPAGNAAPTNPMINGAINQAISIINTDSGFTENLAVTIPIVATLNSGPQWSSLTGAVTPALEINTVERVVWNDGINTPTLLIPTDIYEQDRDRMLADQQQPGTPMYYMVSGYQLGILPPSNTNGTLQLYCRTGIAYMVNDNDTISLLPSDYQTGVLVKVARDLSYRGYGLGAKEEIASRAQMYNADWSYWSNAIKKFVQTIVSEYQPSLVPASHRRHPGMMRVRR